MTTIRVSSAIFATAIAVTGCSPNINSQPEPIEALTQPSTQLENSDRTILLSEDEKKALEQDMTVIEVLANADPSNLTVADIFPDAVPIPPMLYWVNDNEVGLAHLKALLNEGADINEGYEYFGVKGLTALHVAAQEGYFDTVKFLVANGANPNIKSETGQTPADLAEENHPEVAKYLRVRMK